MNLEQTKFRNPEAKLWDQTWRQLGNIQHDHPRIQLSTQLYIPFRALFHGQIGIQIRAQLANEYTVNTIEGL